MLTELYFDPQGESLQVKFLVKNGVLAAAYQIKLSLKDSNQAAATFDGDNQNTEDDLYHLPNSAAENDGRVLRLMSDFKGLDLGMSKKYTIALEVFQGGKLIGTMEESGNLIEGGQHLMLFGKLIAR